MPVILPIPPSTVTFIDPITQGVNIQWQNFLQSIAQVSGTFAPTDAEYWVSTANAGLTNEINLGTLTTGYMKLTVAAAIGLPSTVASIPGTDVTGAALTKTDDTNVTLTLGGAPSTALLRAASLTLGWTGTLSVARGGTNLASGTSGGILGYTGTTTLASSALLAAGYTVIGGGAGATPTAVATGAPVVVALTDGATPALDASLGTVFTLSAAGNRTIAVPSNPTSGQKIVIEHTASGGARTLALNTGAGGFRFGTDITGLTATSSGKTDYIGCIYNGGASFFDVVAYVKGF